MKKLRTILLPAVLSAALCILSGCSRELSDPYVMPEAGLEQLVKGTDPEDLMA